LKYIHACERQAWHLELVRRDGSNPVPLRVRYRCHSWRHAGECRQWCGACDFARVTEAIELRNDWSYLVLTYPARDWPRSRLHELFRFGVVAWSRLRKRLVRDMGPIAYIQTWEVHQSLYPHCNILIGNKNLQDRAKLYARGNTIWKREWLEPALVECGFGSVSYLASMRNANAMAGYLVKLANELTGAAIKSQLPLNAPRHFRRLRASKGLLPPRAASPDYTGKIVRSPLPEYNPTVPNAVSPLVHEDEEQCPLSQRQLF